MLKREFVRSMLLRPPSLRNSALTVAATVLTASVLRSIFGAAAEPVPFVTYFPAIVVTTLLAGWRAGLVSIFVSIAVVKLVYKQPRAPIVADLQSFAMATLFILSCVMLVVICQWLRTTFASLKAATDRAEFLNQELIHRVRNSLSIVNSLAALTYQTEPTQFMSVFSKRMSALASGLDVLSRQGGDQCDLRETVQKACAPFDYRERIEISGPTCSLPGSLCVPLTLAMHELCTNAVKYGAFSNPGGKVTIQLGGDSCGGAWLVWRETGGPPVVKPDKQGLGTALLSHPSLGPAKLTFLETGLQCEMQFSRATLESNASN